MIEQEVTDADAERLPPGEYPIWSPYDSYEAAKALMILAEDEAAHKPGNGLPVSETQTPTVLPSG